VINPSIDQSDSKLIFEHMWTIEHVNVLTQTVIKPTTRTSIYSNISKALIRPSEHISVTEKAAAKAS
jgi:hypothetical protein